MRNNIKNVIFDWGNVLIDVSMECFTKACKENGIVFTEEEVNSTHKAGFFLEYEKGNISDQTFRDEIRSRAAIKLSNEKIDSIWNTMLGAIPPEKLQLLHVLRNHYNLYLLSNTNSIHWNYFSKKCFNYNGLNVNDFFKGIYLSYMLHTAKPDKTIFQIAMKDANLNIDETLFIDDSIINCETAKNLGIMTLNYKPGENLTECVFKILDIDHDIKIYN